MSILFQFLVSESNFFYSSFFISHILWVLIPCSDVAYLVAMRMMSKLSAKLWSAGDYSLRKIIAIKHFFPVMIQWICVRAFWWEDDSEALQSCDWWWIMHSCAKKFKNKRWIVAVRLKSRLEVFMRIRILVLQIEDDKDWRKDESLLQVKRKGEEDEDSISKRERNLKRVLKIREDWEWWRFNDGYWISGYGGGVEKKVFGRLKVIENDEGWSMRKKILEKFVTFFVRGDFLFQFLPPFLIMSISLIYPEHCECFYFLLRTDAPFSCSHFGSVLLNRFLFYSVSVWILIGLMWRARHR